MDYSSKVITEHKPSQQQNKGTYFASSSSLSDHVEESHRCPSCPAALSSLKLLTHHLRSHHSPRGTHSSGEEDYTCGVCHKVLSSASSLDRHLLVHSGEKPFKCKLCEMAFTTNGNMNRHLRTAHGVQSLRTSRDSETSNISEKSTKRRRVEQNNNNEIVTRNSPEPVVEYEYPSSTVIMRNSLDSMDELEAQRNHETVRNSSETETNNNENIAIRKCQVCHRQDFASMALLEAHLQHSHPEVQPKCEICDIVFKDHRVSNHHWFLRHFLKKTVTSIVRNFRNSSSPPSDLSFFISSIIDFSSNTDLFFEESLPRPSSETNPVFHCSKCLRKFPCVTTLQATQEAHEPNCEKSNSENRGQAENQPQNFLGNLNLQKMAVHTNDKITKDPTDVQNTSTVTSGLIPQDNLRSGTRTPDNFTKINLNVGTSSSSGASSSSSSEYQEEVQDVFADDSRVMKFKKEFPCRLCTETFSNLRALKSHNRVHMNVDPGVPYFCNICPYTNTEKVSLIKHLKSHKGVRPFECSLCNYAFTTKANCERHIRSIHGKLTREEIKSALIYHPNEDIATDASECESPVPFIKKDARKTLVYTKIHDESIRQHYHHSTLPVSTDSNSEIQVIKKPNLPQPEVLSLVVVNNYEKPEFFSRTTNIKFMERGRWSEKPEKFQELATEPSYFKDNQDSTSSCSSVSLVSEIKSEQHKKTQDGPINLKITPGYPVNVGDSKVEDVPLDLTKKSMSNNIKQPYLSVLSVSNAVDISNANLPLNGGLINTTHAKAPQNFLQSLPTSACSMHGGFSTVSLKHNRILPYHQDPHLMRVISAAINRVQTKFLPNLKETNDNRHGEPSEIQSNIFQVQDLLPEPITDRNNDSNPIFSQLSNNVVVPEEDRENSTIPKSIKMAAKNRALTHKRKQTRYRTERPFECVYCSVRFTLKNNMDRHIKHQHPEYRNQGSRKGHSTRSRFKTRYHVDVKSETNLSQHLI